MVICVSALANYYKWYQSEELRSQGNAEEGADWKNPLTGRGRAEIAADSCVEGFGAWAIVERVHLRWKTDQRARC
jgi:hypothetical protein